MRRNLIRYLPDILKRNLDFRILMEVQEKYGLQPVWEAAQAVLDDQFITTPTSTASPGLRASWA